MYPMKINAHARLFKVTNAIKNSSRLWMERRYSSEYVFNNEGPAPTCGSLHAKKKPCSSKPCAVPCPASGACPAVADSECDEKLQSCLTKDACDGAIHQHKLKHGEKRPTGFKSMWGDLKPIECILPIRHDMEYYHSSDKLKRKYQQTWDECGAIKRKRKICCFDDLPEASPACTERRKLKVQSAVPGDDGKFKIDYELLKKCMNKSIKKIPKEIPRCLKIRLACCQPVAKNLKCKGKPASKCKKTCTPYPSYSECQRPPTRKRRPVECKCTRMEAGCIVVEFLKRKIQFNIPPPLPAWPPRPK
uniref:Uncharacterized protein n=1 Tax=Glossina pallidipes TaxID=7398 RepID=A0A1B0AAZ4_GLOPL